MSKVTVQAQASAKYSVNREKVQPSDLAAKVKQKIEEALTEQGVEVAVSVKAWDG